MSEPERDGLGQKQTGEGLEVVHWSELYFSVTSEFSLFQATPYNPACELPG
jgi:hypothetical protein